MAEIQLKVKLVQMVRWMVWLSTASVSALCFSLASGLHRPAQQTAAHLQLANLDSCQGWRYWRRAEDVGCEGMHARQVSSDFFLHERAMMAVKLQEYSRSPGLEGIVLRSLA